MFMTPAVALGALVVFAAGYVVTRVVFSKIAKRRKGPTVLYRDTLKEVNSRDDWTEEHIDGFAKVGGGIAVVLVLLLLFVIPREGFTLIWIVLTVLGVLFGLLTFLR